MGSRQLIIILCGFFMSTGCSRPLDRCAIVSNRVETCLLGEAFVECEGEGEGEPRLLCTAATECVWVSNGCPFGEFQHPAPGCSQENDATMEEARMFGFTSDWGLRPWDRARAMNLAVLVDPALPARGPAVTCSACGDMCLTGNPCDREVDMRRRFPGTLVLDLWPVGPLHAWWYILMEIDAPRGKARVLRLSRSDVIACGEQDPVVASQGTVTLSQAPTAENVMELHGRFSFVYEDGVVVEGEF